VNADAIALGGQSAVRRNPALFVSAVACASAVALLAALPWLIDPLGDRPQDLAAFAVLALVLQLVPLEIYGRGAVRFPGAALLAAGFLFGTAAAIGVAAVSGIAFVAARRTPRNRAVFDAAQSLLAAGAGALAYGLLPDPAAPVAAGVVYAVVWLGLLGAAHAVAERGSPAHVWRERLRWLAPFAFATGPLAWLLAETYTSMGVPGLAAVAVGPVGVMLVMRRYVTQTQEGDADTRRSAEELEVANEELAERNRDLQALIRVTGGLAARTHDRGELVAYAEEALSAVAGSPVALDERGALEAGPTVDQARWRRLRDAVAPHLTAALDAAELEEQVRRTHMATIAALSKSMEAKDLYTGGHTERVASVALALAQRLGFVGEELEAIEIGALLHDIGKIGIPERILQKPGPLDEDEWAIMKEHPVISEFILVEAGLNPIVLQVARSSHERIDGGGYPDGRAGDDIPLPARIVLVADAFDALTSDRPYRLGRSVDEALDELREHTGTQFCPVVVAAMERLYAEEPEALGVSEAAAVTPG
jgi:putative nucleotidyltransferase with HDIG domain